MSRIGRGFRLALGFLTVLPVGTLRGEVTPAELAASRFFYPPVGLLIGAVLAGLSLGLSRIGAPGATAAWGLVAVSVVLTGGLHLDGLADTFDGLFLGGGPQRRLEVMRDPRVGSHGVVAVALVLIGKVMAVQAIGDGRRALALLGAAAIARTLLLLSAGMAGYARPEGTGRLVIESAGLGGVLAAVVLALAIGAATCGTRGLVGGLVAIAVVMGLTALSSRRLGGITGDTLGASVELGELAFLLAV
ncbi:MAG: cobalamin 5-phosphate synthase/cobalamin synthase [Planctomycetota bacterium]|nr:cobalamin 5-phosphate synthase/cobalamin synthase [Planctomycetota bacterium]